MADFTLRTRCATQVTCVSNEFIDNYMGEANGEYVKLYLCLLRFMGSPNSMFSLDDIADRLDCTSRDIVRGLKYWEKCNLLKLEYDGKEIVDICLLDSNGQNAVVAPVAKTKTTVASAPLTVSKEESVTPDIPDYSALILSEYADNDEFLELTYVIQKYLKRPVSPKESDYLIFWHQDLGFDYSLISYLVETCIDSGHDNFTYMNKIALDWNKNNIHTEEDAKADRISHSEAVIRVIKAFGITGRTLIADEKSYVSTWLNQYGMSIDLVEEACVRSAKKTGKASFEYANTIIESWHKSNIKSLSEVAKSDESFNAAIAGTANNKKPSAASEGTAFTGKTSRKNNFINYNQRQIDYDAIEKKLMGQ